MRCRITTHYNLLHATNLRRCVLHCHSLSTPSLLLTLPRRHSKTITAQRKVSGGIGHSVPVAVAARIRVFTRRTAPYLGVVR